MEAAQPALRPLSGGATARARAQAYGLLSRLVLRGLDAPARALVEALPVLREALPADADADADALAASHYTLFSLQAFPYESVYRDESGQPGGTVSEAVADDYRRAGFGLRFDDVTADHLGAELAFLSFLSAAEADARRERLDDAAERCRELSAAFLARHLMAWLPPFAAACAAQRPSLWTTVVALVVELSSSHVAELGCEDASRQDSPLPLPDLPGADLLEDPKTDLKRIANHLCRPREAGVLLTRADLEAIGRELSLPTGFGSRAQRLQCLLESAAEYQSFSSLACAIDAVVRTRMEGYRAFDSAAELWLSRAEVTRGLLCRLAAANSSHLSTTEK